MTIVFFDKLFFLHLSQDEMSMVSGRGPALTIWFPRLRGDRAANQVSLHHSSHFFPVKGMIIMRPCAAIRNNERP